MGGSHFVSFHLSISLFRSASFRICLAICLVTGIASAQVGDPTSPATDATSSNSAAPLTKETAAVPAASGGGVFPAVIAAPSGPQENLSQRCWSREASSSECKVHWAPAVGETIEHLLFLNGMNLVKDKSLRNTSINAIERGDFIQRWINSASNYWFTHWDQDSPWKDTYIGHPFLGAIQQGIWVQNDPYGQTMQWDNSMPYWKSRLRALPLTVAASFEWKLGPIGEAAFGNSGIGHNKGIYFESATGKQSNDTGLGPLVTTPIGGFFWFWGEDLIDRHLLPKLEAKSHNPLYLFAISMMNPARGSANLLRFKAPWYRPYRHVKAQWHKTRPPLAEAQP